jgi:hypothetical protein
VTEVNGNEDLEDLGNTSFHTYNNGHIYEIVYLIPRGKIITNEDLNNSEYIRTMDLILQSIDWHDND